MQGQNWTVSAAPSFKAEIESGPVCSAGGDHECLPYVQVAGLTRLSNGQIVLLNGGTKQLVYYDPSTGAIRKVGRAGQGPGEFEDPRAMCRFRGDSLMVSEGNRTNKYYSSNGTFSRESTYRFPTGSTGALVSSIAGCFADGRFVVSSSGATQVPRNTSARNDSTWLWGVPTLFFGTAGIVEKVVLGLPVARVRARNGAAVLETFSARNIRAVGKQLYYTGFGESYIVDAFDATGALRMSIRRSVRPAPVTARDIANYKLEVREASLKRQPPPSEQQLNSSLESMHFAREYPVFSRMLIDAAENLWVQDWTRPRADVYDGGTSAAAWNVFDPTGIWLGTVTMPPSLKVVEIGADYVLGTMKDADELVHLVLHPLAKTRGD